MFFVYLIHNIVNNKVYIGKSQNPAKRWKKHIVVAFCKRKIEKFYIHHAIKKYGPDNFIFSIIQKFEEQKVCDEAEKYWIVFFDTKNSKFGYNLTDGGEGCYGRVYSEETKEKIRVKATGRKHSAETKEKIRQLNIGKRQSKESIEKTRQANLGKKLNEDHRRKISEATVGKKKYRLTKEQVIEVRRLYEKENWSQRAIADLFGMRLANVSFIVTYRTWKTFNRKRRGPRKNKKDCDI